MMKIFKVFFSFLCVFTFTLSFQSEAKSRPRKPAGLKDGSVHEVILVYNNDANNFRKIKLHLTPYAPYMSFESFGNQEYILDCPNSGDSKGWTCFSPCEGGSIKISFSQKTGFKEIKIDPFKIQPRLCDGSEDENDPELTSRQALTFRLKGIQPKLPAN